MDTYVCTKALNNSCNMTAVQGYKGWKGWFMKKLLYSNDLYSISERFRFINNNDDVIAHN